MAGALILSALLTLGAPAARAGMPVMVDPMASPTVVQATARARILAPVKLRRRDDKLSIEGEADMPQVHRAPRADRIDAVDFY